MNVWKGLDIQWAQALINNNTEVVALAARPRPATIAAQGRVSPSEMAYQAEEGSVLLGPGAIRQREEKAGSTLLLQDAGLACLCTTDRITW